MSSNQNLPQSIRLLTVRESIELRIKLEDTIAGLRNRYFPTLDDDEFMLTHCFHESVFMKCVAFRFLNTEIFSSLRNAVSLATHGVVSATEYLYHPVFYTRFSSPHVQYNSAYLDTQPHYDKSFQAFAYSFWLGLCDISSDTGGLCFFRQNRDLERLFEVDSSGTNKFNYTKYVDLHQQLDSLLIENCIPPTLTAGQAFWFDSNVLHAATKPRTLPRLSLDFRLVQRGSINSTTSSFSKIVSVINSNLEFSNAMNLFSLGDTEGAEDLCPDMHYIAKTYGFNCAIIQPITGSDSKLSWRTEYSWCR